MGAFEQVKSYSYFEFFWINITTVMWENYKSSVPYTFAPFVRVFCSCCLFSGININFVAASTKPAGFSQNILRSVPAEF